MRALLLVACLSAATVPLAVSFSPPSAARLSINPLSHRSASHVSHKSVLGLAPSPASTVSLTGAAASPAAGHSSFARLALGGGSGGNGGIVRRGGGGGGGGDDGEEGEGGDIAALLKQYGVVASQLPKGAEKLDPKALQRFLDAYANKLNRWLIDSWPAWRDKVLADPEFGYKLFVEETVGLGLAMSGTVAARGKDLLKELDFFFTDCAVGAVINFVIIWLLAPSVGKAAATTGIAATIGKLPAFALAEGKYSVAQRVGAGVYKGSLFSACGFLGSLGGTTLAYLLFQARKLINPEGSQASALPNVLANSLGWGSFMFVSTNPRYQLINGIEQVMYKALPTGVGKAGSLALRTGNNMVGGATWVLWARFIGLQKKTEGTGKGKGKKK